MKFEFYLPSQASFWKPRLQPSVVFADDREDIGIVMTDVRGMGGRQLISLPEPVDLFLLMFFSLGGILLDLNYKNLVAPSHPLSFSCFEGLVKMSISPTKHIFFSRGSEGSPTNAGLLCSPLHCCCWGSHFCRWRFSG